MDEELLELLRGGTVPYVIVLTKADKLSRNQQVNRVRDTTKYLAARGIEVPIVLTSAEKKQGAEDVWRWAALLAQF
jgi:GTP-binding protein